MHTTKQDRDFPALARFLMISLGASLVVVASLYSSWIILAYISRMQNWLYYNDFGKFYYSARYYVEGLDMYGPSPSTLVPIRNFPNAQLLKHFWNMNPPLFQVLMAPLATMKIANAYFVWVAINAVALMFSIHRIVKEVGIRIAPWNVIVGFFFVVSFAGTGTTFLTGQLSFLLLLPMTFIWLYARNEKWERAGIILGMVTPLKPFLLIVWPLFLIRGKLRAFFSATLSALVSISIGLAIVGVEPHLRWVRMLGSVDWHWAVMNGSIHGFIQRVVSPSPQLVPVADMGSTVGILWISTSIFMACITFTFCLLDRSKHSIDRSLALTLVLGLLISPLGWIYYGWLVAGPLVLLIHSWNRGSSEKEDRNCSWVRKARNGLLLSSVIGLAWPLFGIGLLLPGFKPLLTISIASVYFWAYLFLWLSLAADFLLAGKLLTVNAA